MYVTVLCQETAGKEHFEPGFTDVCSLYVTRFVRLPTRPSKLFDNIAQETQTSATP